MIKYRRFEKSAVSQPRMLALTMLIASQLISRTSSGRIWAWHSLRYVSEAPRSLGLVT
jgi:hypothetical protein